VASSASDSSRPLTGNAWSDLLRTIELTLQRGGTEIEPVELLLIPNVVVNAGPVTGCSRLSQG
jgi:hypothetical protein